MTETMPAPKTLTNSPTLARPSKVAQHLFGVEMTREEFATKIAAEGCSTFIVQDADDDKLFPRYCVTRAKDGTTYVVTRAEYRLVEHANKAKAAKAAQNPKKTTKAMKTKKSTKEN